jgi:hypothetical protein
MYFFFPQDSVRLKLKFDEKSNITLLDFSSLSYDLTLLHDCLVLSTLSDYKDYTFNRFFWYRNGRPLKESHQLFLERVKMESPLEMVTVLSVAGTSVGLIWVLVQAFEKISNWHLNRRILELQVQNLEETVKSRRLDNQSKQLDNARKQLELEELLSQKGSREVFDRIVERFESYPFAATDARIFSGREPYDTNINDGS